MRWCCRLPACRHSRHRRKPRQCAVGRETASGDGGAHASMLQGPTPLAVARDNTDAPTGRHDTLGSTSSCPLQAHASRASHPPTQVFPSQPPTPLWCTEQRAGLHGFQDGPPAAVPWAHPSLLQGPACRPAWPPWTGGTCAWRFARCTNRKTTRGFWGGERGRRGAAGGGALALGGSHAAGDGQSVRSGCGRERGTRPPCRLKCCTALLPKPGSLCHPARPRSPHAKLHGDGLPPLLLGRRRVDAQYLHAVQRVLGGPQAREERRGDSRQGRRGGRETGKGPREVRLQGRDAAAARNRPPPAPPHRGQANELLRFGVAPQPAVGARPLGGVDSCRRARGGQAA